MSSNPRRTIGVFTMCAPLIVLGCAFSICTTWNSVSGIEIKRTIGKVTSTICDDTLYLQILNGICNRGVVVGIDVDASCSGWDDASHWKTFDSDNLLKVSLKSNSTSKFMKTDMATEAPGLWQTIKYFMITCMALACANLLLNVLISDIDPNKFPVDPEKYGILASLAMNCTIIVLTIYSTYSAAFSDLLNTNAWSTTDCTYTVGYGFGFYLLIVGGFFSLASVVFGILSFLKIYVYTDGLINALPLELMAKLGASVRSVVPLHEIIIREDPGNDFRGSAKGSAVREATRTDNRRVIKDDSDDGGDDDADDDDDDNNDDDDDDDEDT